MELEFYKYQGTGNDFILIDNRKSIFPENNIQLISALCSRKFGIGSDGLMLVNYSQEFDFELVFFNPDGSQSLCGNGSRCAVRFANDLGIIKDKTIFMAYDGPHEAQVLDTEIHLQMHDVPSFQSLEDGFFADTGSPHFVAKMETVEALDILEAGSKIRYDKRFEPSGTNANFIEMIGNESIKVRTYERGVENETLSCGTGVTASAIYAHELGVQSPVRVQTKGGNLSVKFTKQENKGYTDVWLIGPAVKVFKGFINI